MRDVAPTFLSDKSAISWKFTGWGHPRTIAHDKDALVAVKICNTLAYPCKRLDFVCEGGSIIVDGKGTMLVTEETLLNKNRNPTMSKREIESVLCHALGVSKVIWLPFGIANDTDTAGHVDNMAIFYDVGKVLLTWPEGCGTGACVDKEQEMRSLAALKVLESATDARGRPIKVTFIPHPPPMYYTKEESMSPVKGSFHRKTDTRMASTYINMIFCNEMIVVPTFNQPTDAIALKIMADLFPKKKVVGVYSRDLNLGGGNIHCMSQQQP
jgi:agmatine deiminase